MSDEDYETINLAAAELGYSPLRVYRGHESYPALDRWAMQGVVALNHTLLEKIDRLSKGDENVLVVGHAVITNEVVTHYVDSAQLDLLLDTDLGECHCLVVDITTGVVDLIAD